MHQPMDMQDVEAVDMAVEAGELAWVGLTGSRFARRMFGGGGGAVPQKQEDNTAELLELLAPADPEAAKILKRHESIRMFL